MLVQAEPVIMNFNNNNNNNETVTINDTKIKWNKTTLKKKTWNLILITSSGDVTVREIPPEIAPADESMIARFSWLGSSIAKKKKTSLLRLHFL